MPYLIFIITALVFIILLKLIFKVKFKTILKFIINIVLGGLVLFLINYIPGINIEIDIFKSIVVGLLGVPGVIIVLIYYFLIEK